MEKFDTIIVGTGVAGLYATLNLERSKNILLITKDDLENSDSYLAQGGISALLSDEDYDTYFEDTMKAGKYKNDKTAVAEMIRQSHSIVGDLIEIGVDFDRTPDGDIAFTREGGHSVFRILHHKDVTGKEIVEKLMASVKKLPNVTMRDHQTMVDLVTDGNECRGIVVRKEDGSLVQYFARDTILATGGIGGLFRNSTNFPHITGDSFALAIRNNIELENLNYIQIHPTVLFSKNKGRRFLISESARGEGAYLVNEDGERFVNELLPRDVVTDAICKEMQKSNTDHVYLNFSKIEKEEILNHFPNIYKRCLEEGYDITKEPIPVTPAQHYLMGGIKADLNGQTSMKNLFAVGETACNGVHGANRLASNSLLESLVFARNASRKINNDKSPMKETMPLADAQLKIYEDVEKWSENNRQMVMNEIKEKDKEFYDKWCNFQTQH